MNELRDRVRDFIVTIESALRPTTHTPKLNSAVRNGVENDEKNSATAVSINTSPSVSASAARIGNNCKSVVPATAADAASTMHDHGTTTAVRSGAFHAIRPSTAGAPISSATTSHGLTPACTADTHSCTAPWVATNTNAVSAMPKYLPSRNS